MAHRWAVSVMDYDTLGPKAMTAVRQGRPGPNADIVTGPSETPLPLGH